MITDNDIEKIKKRLEKIFITKDEFKKTSDDIIDSLKIVISMVGEVSEKLDKTIVKDKEQNDNLNDHERRLDKIEDKVFSRL